MHVSRNYKTVSDPTEYENIAKITEVSESSFPVLKPGSESKLLW